MHDVLAQDKDESHASNSSTPSTDKKDRCAVCSVPADKRCSKCHKVYYCSAEHQKQDWRRHRPSCNSSNPSVSTSIVSNSKSNVLWIHLEMAHDFLKDTTDHFQDLIKDKVTIIRAYDEPTALLLLNSAQFAAVIILTSLPTETYPALIKALVSYATDKGGTVITGFAFPSFMNMSRFQRFFKQFGKNWTGGSYERRDFIRNDGNNSTQIQNPIQEFRRRSGNPLPKSYSMKALSAKGVTRDEAVYLNERFQNPKQKGDDLEAPVAFASVGKGWLGYLGDVNIEAPTQLVAKAMLGLHGNK